MFKRIILATVLWALCAVTPIAAQSLMLLGAGGSGGPSYSPQAAAYFAQVTAAGQTLTPTRMGQIDTLFRALNFAGLASEIDGAYLLNSPTEPTNRINMLSSLYNGLSASLTSVGAGPTCTSNVGCSSASTSNYYGSHFDPSLATYNYTGTNSSLFAYVQASAHAAFASLVSVDAASQLIDHSPTTSGIYAAANSTVSGFYVTYPITPIFGLVATSQHGTALNVYENGVWVGTRTETLLSLASATASIFNVPSSNAGKDTLSFVGWGALSSTYEHDDATNLAWAFQNYNNICCGTVPTAEPNYISTPVAFGSNTLGQPVVNAGIVRLPDGRLYWTHEQWNIGAANVTQLVSEDGSGTNGSWDSTSLGSSTIAAFSGYNVQAFYATLLPNGTLLGLGYYRPSTYYVTFTSVGTITPGGAVTWSAPASVFSTGACGASTQCAPSAPLIVLANGNWFFSLFDQSGNVYTAIASGCPSSCSWALNQILTTSLTTVTTYNNQTTSPLASNYGVSCVSGTTTTSTYNFLSESTQVQLPNGKIILVFRNSSGTVGTVCTAQTGLWEMDSTDNGVTWSSAAQILAQQTPGNPTMVVSPSGNLFIFGRMDGVPGYIYSSLGGGAGNWSAAQFLNLRYGYEGAISLGNFAYGQAYWDATTSSVLVATMLGQVYYGIESSVNYGGKFFQFLMP